MKSDCSRIAEILEGMELEALHFYATSESKLRTRFKNGRWWCPPFPSGRE